MKIKYITVTLFSTIAFYACNKDSDKKSTPQSTAEGFLKATDLVPGKLYDLSESDAKSSLEYSEKLRASSRRNETTDGKTSEETEELKKYVECQTEQLNAFKIQASKEAMTIEGTIDMGKCTAGAIAAQKDTKVNHFKYSNRFLTIIKCDNEDFSQYNGKSAGILIKDFKPCLKSTSISELNHNFADEDSSVTTSGITAERKVKIYSALSTAEGKPCARTKSGNEWILESGCVDVTRIVTELDKHDGAFSPRMGAEEYERFQLDGIKMKDDESLPWFSAGKMLVTIGKWNGEVKFTDANVAPAYSMTNGKVTVSGSARKSEPTKQMLLTDVGVGSLHKLVQKLRILGF